MLARSSKHATFFKDFFFVKRISISTSDCTVQHYYRDLYSLLSCTISQVERVTPVQTLWCWYRKSKCHCHRYSMQHHQEANTVQTSNHTMKNSVFTRACLFVTSKHKSYGCGKAISFLYLHSKVYSFTTVCFTSRTSHLLKTNAKHSIQLLA